MQILFINKNGFIMVDPQYKNLMKDDQQNISKDKDIKGLSKNFNESNGMSTKTEDFQQKELESSIPTKRMIPKKILGKPGRVYYKEAAKTKSFNKNKNAEKFKNIIKIK